MKALLFRETGEPKNGLKVEEIPTPPLGSGEALVRVLTSPICVRSAHGTRALWLSAGSYRPTRALKAKECRISVAKPVNHSHLVLRL